MPADMTTHCLYGATLAHNTRIYRHICLQYGA